MEPEHVDVWAELRTLCAHVMSVPLEAVVPHARLVADLGADSLDINELQVASEERFGVSLRGADRAAVSTVGDVASLVATLRAQRVPGAVAG
ncbi:acyl carrier protein [Streptomyces sp. YS-3]|uniref:acyl carrier protein n=1 Tax=Streptomyces sp. YS-3 TaxID=3381352 RepID=UPI003862BA40